MELVVLWLNVLSSVFSDLESINLQRWEEVNVTYTRCVRMKLDAASKTTNKIPPPGPRRITLGTNPL